MKLKGPLFNEENDNGGGGGMDVWDEPARQASEQPQQQNVPPQQQQPTQQQPSQQQQPAPQVVQLERGQLSQELTQALRSVMPQQQPQQQAAMTDEEWDKLTHVYRATDQDVQDMFGDPPADLSDTDKARWVAVKKAAIQRQIDGSAKHSIAVSRLASGSDLRALREQVQPLLTQSQQREVNTFMTSLVNGDATLKALPNNGGAQLVQAAVQSLKSERFSPATHEEGVKGIMTRVEQIARTINPNFSLSPGGGGAGASRARGMASSVNGGGGGGHNNGGGQPKIAGLDLYDK